MDILCVGMLRSCSTWQYEVVSHLVERQLAGTRIGYLEGPEYAAQPPARSGVWRVVKAHYRDEVFAAQIAEGKARAVYAYRDVRDVVFSMCHKFGLSFEEVLASGKLHALLEDDRFWRAQPGILMQRYGDIVARPVTSVRELARFLGVTLDPGEAGKIATEYSFESNLKRTTNLTRRLKAEGVDLNDHRNVFRHDPSTLLHWNHLRSGRIGAWREEATLTQRRAMAELFGPWLEQNGYELDDLPPPGTPEASLGTELRETVGVVRQSLSSLAHQVANRPARGLSFLGRVCSRLPKRLTRWLAAILLFRGI